MIEVDHLTKRYGDKTAIDSLSFVVRPGVVTGFLGPNGAGKSTTMRLIAGLDEPTSGSARVDGQRFRNSRAPLAELGVLLEARAMHPGRSARNHLLAIARTAGLGRRRVDDVIELVGLGDVAAKRIGGFSLGMGQRLGIAAALLGQPRTIVLDEPINGLDPEGVRWVRELLRSLADEGRTVFLSSHLMTEMAHTADRVIVIGRGRLVADTTLDEFVARTAARSVTVRTPQSERLRVLLVRADATVTTVRDDVLEVRGLAAEQVGTLAWEANLPLYQLSAASASLEDAFMQATHDSVEFGAASVELAR
jgi:ABC-2 type transport system ATP-binding protein